MANSNNFGINNGSKSGLNARCKTCYQKHSHDNYLNNKGTYKENMTKKIANNEFNRTFNDYIIDGDVTKIIMTAIDGKEVITLIDTEDLERVKSFGMRWCIKYYKEMDSTYADATNWEEVNGQLKFTSHRLNNLLLNPPKGFCTDHINHDTLDNRKVNLRTVSVSNNGRNRKGKNSNNKSGYRNVCWINNQWVVQLQIDGKNTRLAYFDDVDEAGQYAEKMRQKYYGEYAGKS